MIDSNVFAELQNRGIITHTGLKAEDFTDMSKLVAYGIATSTSSKEVYEDVLEDIAQSEEVVNALAAFLEAVAAGGKVTLDRDYYITNADMINVTKDVVLDLNGHTITKAGLTASGKCVLFYVKGANLTITGNGNVNVESGKTDIAVWSDKGATVNIESGNFHGIGQPSGSDLIYAMNGKINVSGGTFKLDNMDEVSFAEPQYSLLNAYGAKVDTAKNFINVTGGKFFKFDPANNVSEGVGTSFVANKYKSIVNGDWFEVSIVLTGTTEGVTPEEGNE